MCDLWICFSISLPLSLSLWPFYMSRKMCNLHIYVSLSRPLSFSFRPFYMNRVMCPSYISVCVVLCSSRSVFPEPRPVWLGHQRPTFSLFASFSLTDLHLPRNAWFLGIVFKRFVPGTVCKVFIPGQNLMIFQLKSKQKLMENGLGRARPDCEAYAIFDNRWQSFTLSRRARRSEATPSEAARGNRNFKETGQGQPKPESHQFSIRM